jgi:addiction module HigA family antidote
MVGKQHNPPHPGEVLWGLDMEPAGITINELAGKLGVDRKTISRIVNGHAAISAEMAILLGRAFNTSPDVWMNMQRNYELYKANQRIHDRAQAIRPFDHKHDVSTPIFHQ